MKKQNLAVLLLALASLTIAGCGDSLPQRVKVHGKVTLQGQPLEGAIVTFEPVGNSENRPLRPAQGVTNAQGHYQLTSFRADDGTMPGNYAVLVHMNSAYSIDGEPLAPPTKTLPEKYGRSDTTDLSATIPADASSEMELNFDLKP